MNTRIPLAVLAGAFVVLATADARAEYRSIPFHLGDSIQSVIEPVDDRDSFAFDGIEGTKITVKVSAAKGTDLVPALDLFGPDGRALDVSARLKAKKQKVQLKKFELPATGRYVLRITSANDAGGAFTVTTKGKPPGSRSFKGVALAPGATQAFAIPAESDATLKVAVKGKGQGCEVVSVKDPAKAEIPGGVAAFEQMGPSKKAKATLLLAQGFGAYAITVGKAPEPTTLKVKLKVKFAKREADLIEVPAVEPNSTPIAKLQPITGDVHGAISFPFTLQDPEGDTVSVHYKYGIDLDGDGEIRSGTGEEWRDPTPIDGSAGTSLDTEPWDEPVGYAFVWDSVRDIGSPGRDSGRKDVVFRVYPRDVDPGVADQITDFRIVLDPDGLYLVRWGPEGEDSLRPGEVYTGEVELNRPLVFHFNTAIEPGSLTKDTLYVHAGLRVVTGYYELDGKTVTFYPQVQEIPPRADVLEPKTAYSIEIAGYDPTTPRATLCSAAGSASNYATWVCLVEDDMDDAFTTSDVFVAETGKPSLTSLDVPATLTGVSVDTKVVLTLSEPIDPASLEFPNFQLVVSTANGNVVVPVNATLRNIVGPPRVRKGIITLTPKLTLPASATVRVILSGAIEDLAGNSLVMTTRSFTTETGTPQSFTTTESFTSTKNRNKDLTTAYWGTRVPGRLTGLGEGGTGYHGALHVKSGTTTLSKNVYHFTTLTVEEGATLKFSTTSAVELYVQGDVTIKGTIDVSGGKGEDSPQEYFYQTRPGSEDLKGTGGAGGPGGADGGSTAATLPTSSDTTNYDAGEDGKGAGAGTGGGIAWVASWLCRGGGGGGYATPGEDAGDQDDSKANGKGGGTYGTATLSMMRGGSGGGGGTSRCYYYYGSPSDWYYRLSVGGAGGGGGGSIKIVTDGKIDLASTGNVLSRGGDGGRPYLAGEGGGGSGGDILLRAARGIEKNGLLDVRGGKGAMDGYHYKMWAKAGDGGAGRVRLEEPEPVEQIVNVFGDFLAVVNPDITDGGSLAGSDGRLAPQSDLTLTTSSSKSTWYFSEINIRSGVTVTIKGDRAARLLSRDGITVRGVIRAEGGDGEGYVPWEKLTSGYTSVKGGRAGAGGHRGGRSHTVNGKVDPTKAEDGQGPGGGQGASVNLVIVDGDKEWRPGLGGGASHATKGGEDWRSNAGKAGATYGSTSTMTHANIQGGSGGGGGSNGKHVHTSSTQYFQGGCGGGGGGALVLETPKTLTLTGRVSVMGGDGGSCGASSGLWSGSGGGGSGGSALLRGGKFDLEFGTVDASGGEGGHGAWFYSIAGAGGQGRIKLESKSFFNLLTSRVIQTGSYSCSKFDTRYDTAVSVWFDTGSLSPTYKSLSSTVNPTDGSQTKVWLEVCHTDAKTLGPDEATLKKLTATEVAAGKANGYRFYRFRMKLEPGDKDPYVDEVKVTGSIVKN